MYDNNNGWVQPFTVTGPDAGWQHVNGSPYIHSFWVTDGIIVFTKLVQSSDIGANFTFTFSQTLDMWAASMFALRGQDQVAPLDTAASVEDDHRLPSTGASAVSITPVTNNNLILNLIQAYTAPTYSPIIGTPGSFTNGGVWTKGTEQIGAQYDITYFYATQTNAAATGSIFTPVTILPQRPTFEWINFLLSIRPSF